MNILFIISTKYTCPEDASKDHLNFKEPFKISLSQRKQMHNLKREIIDNYMMFDNQRYVQKQKLQMLDKVNTLVNI